jgi:sugar O-acyltransferase (sialic acid O-acetyltransferase NeuD family)
VLGPTDSKLACQNGIIGIGDNSLREALYKQIILRNPRFNFINAIHPSSIIGKDVLLGDGIAIMAGSVVNSNATIGSHSVINTMVSVDHDSTIESFVSLAPGSHLGGNVLIGFRTFVGMGTTIIHNIHIGHDVVIGAGSTVISDISNQVIAYGSPAKTIRRRSIDEKYL